MAWEWSYTAEGVDNIREQIAVQSRKWLEVCWAENCAAVPAVDDEGEATFGEPDLDQELYAAKLAEAQACEAGNPFRKMISNDALAEAIFAFACQIATCDNGGFDAWCCPWGCHTVSPDPVECEDDDTNAAEC